jgi:predicted amidohydrolase YtcJ
MFALMSTFSLQTEKAFMASEFSRRQLLTAGLLVALSGKLTELSAAEIEPTLQDLGKAIEPVPRPVIYRAKEIITLDPAKPSATAVAVAGDRIIAAGSLDELKNALKGDVTVDATFADKVIVPGFIAQHDHPLLAALTMSSRIIAIEDWVLPQGTSRAAKDHDDYLTLLREAHENIADPNETLLTWGYHHYFHGELKKSELDEISDSRPIVVWHRSAHEFYLNSAAQKKYGVTKDWYDKLSASQKQQSDFENGHYWEQGWFAVLPLTVQDLASPARLKSGLEFVRNYYHANGVTLGCEPGGIASKVAQDAQNAVLSDASSPFRFYFIADGKSITAQFPDEQVPAETEKLLTWGKGMTAYVPKQVKLFADGAIFSQAMQVSAGYLDGHKGEWMMDLNLFTRTMKVYWDNGYQIHIHVNGDAGLDMVLDELERNIARNPRPDHRTVIVHFAVSRPDQVERIKKLSAIVSGNPYYPVALANNYSSNGLGPERANSMVRMGDVERANISYSFHSDMPMAPGQPLLLMWAGVNRITNGGNVVAPEQRVSRLGALKAVTLEAAYSLQMEEEVGSIAPGKLANFTILSDNPVTIDPVKIKDIGVWGTVHEGRVLQVQGASPARKADSDRHTAPKNQDKTEGQPSPKLADFAFTSKSSNLAAARAANDRGLCSGAERALGLVIAWAMVR